MISAIVLHVVTSFKHHVTDKSQKGQVKGWAEGRAEGTKQAAILIAQNMLSSGMSIQQVQEMTNPSAQEIETL